MKRILFSLALAALTGLISCQKETDVKPVVSRETASGARLATQIGVIGSSVEKRLLSEGSVSFEYYTNGQLKLYNAGPFKAEFMYLSAFRADLYPGFKAASGIRMKSYYNGLASEWTLFYLLDDKGVCQRAVLSTPNGKRYFNYIYNAKGQLISLSEPTANDFWIFDYDAQDHLNRVRVFKCGIVEEETQFGYKLPNGSYLDNKLGQYPIVNVPNFLYFRYLPIFGKPDNHLVRRQTTVKTVNNTTLLDYQYDYTLDGDGYINTVVQTNILNNTSTQPIQYGYENLNMEANQ